MKRRGSRISIRLVCSQVESNRQMYRSTMEQVAHFLGRAHRSLEILHAKENPKEKRRVPRSRSVHTVVHVDPSPSRGTATSSPSSSTSSPFTRAKSVTQIESPNSTCFREFTWSVLRRNDPVHCTTPRVKPPLDLNKTNDDNVVYREPKQTELNPDEIPPEKLSQEAFRCVRKFLWKFYSPQIECYTERTGDFAEGSKILLDIDLKIILLDHRNNFVGTSKIMSKKFWYSIDLERFT